MVNGIKNAEIDWWLKSQTISTKVPKQFNKEKEAFSTNGTRYPYGRKRTSSPTSHHKQKLIQDELQTQT